MANPVNILVGCTGSVASLKIPQLIDSLLKLDIKPNIKVVTTSNALHFYDAANVQAPVLCDKDEWEMWSERGDPVLHIELRRWADLLLIAPLDANTLAKIANGFCDNLLTCVVRAWDTARPLLFAPAMNTYMWEHPITEKHVATLKSFGYQEVPCVSKVLECGDYGFGGMAEVKTLVSAVESALRQGEKYSKSISKNSCCT